MPPRHPSHPFNAYSSDTDRHIGSGSAMRKHKKISKTEEKQLLELTNTMGNRITQAMEDNDLSISWIAQQMGVVDRTVSDWRKDGNVSTHRIPLLAKYLNTTVEYLMTGAEAHTFQKVSGDDNVVQMQHNVEHGDISRTTPNIVMRYIGIYELDEISDAVKYNPSDWLKSVKAFAVKPSERTCLAITANKDKLHMPGMPSFVLQYLLDGPIIKRGTHVGYSLDIAPAFGKWCIFAMKTKAEIAAAKKENRQPEFRWAAGYYCTLNHRALPTSKQAHDYAHNNDGFVLRMEPHRPNDDDVYVLPADFEYWKQDCRVIGVATWMSHWLDDGALRHHTGLWERLDRVYESRRLRDKRWNYLEPFNPD